MEAGFKCHKCKSTYEEYLILKCSREKCNNYFCLFCFREKYKKNYTKIFNSFKTKNNFVCFQCLNVCTCELCLSKLPFIPNIISLLAKKRRRFSKKLSFTKNSHYSSKIIISLNHNKEPQEVISSSYQNDNNENNCLYNNSFPNYSNNIILNSIILNSATITHAFRIGRPKKKSNKPCILCNKFKCPPGVEIIKYKTYEDYLNFLYTFFSQIENEQKKTEPISKLPEELYNRIMLQKKNVQQLKDYFKKTISKTDNKLKGPKRFCTNCIANLFREQNGVYSIYESLKDEDEQASLEPKKKLEIIKGLHLLIEKEKENEKNPTSTSSPSLPSNVKDTAAFLHKQLNDNTTTKPIPPFQERNIFFPQQIQDDSRKGLFNGKENIFNQILGDGQDGIINQGNYFDIFNMENTMNNYNYLNQKKGIELTYNCNYNYNIKPKFFFDFKNYNYPQYDYYTMIQQNNITRYKICQSYLNKIYEFAGETNDVLNFIQMKLLAMSYTPNELLAREIRSMTEFLSNRTKILNKSINEYDYVLHNLSE